ANEPHFEKEQNKLVPATMEISYDKPVVLTTDYGKKVQKNNQDCACK
ncbi:13914_t:CDS:1, partial [Dentiscutata erythropus]